jgi:hypothetical protein
MAPRPDALAKDGAKPGATSAPTDRYVYDADAKAATREAAPVTIGGTVYKRRRKNWEATRALRDLLRVQERAATRQHRLRLRIDALAQKQADDAVAQGDDFDEDAAEDAIADLERQVDDWGDKGDEAAYGIIALLLRDGDGNGPTLDHLKQALDVDEAGDLAASLAGGGEPDPTPTTEAS